MTEPVSLRALAKEREARQAKAAGALPSDSPGLSSTTRKAPVATRLDPNALLRAHRSIRIARSIALALLVISSVVGLLGGWRIALVLLFAAVGLARRGGGAVHGALPAMLQEGGPPGAADLTAAATCGLFSGQVMSHPGRCLALEWEVALENLAFACTYGKRNCLTNEMYSGELSLGKVCRLVWGKLSEGTVRCY
jgi:hypothetical protein